MKRKRYTAYLLLLTALLVAAAPLVPHHHHVDGIVCMKHDLCNDCTEHQDEASHHCCHTDGLATHFTAITEEQDDKPETDGIVLYVEPLLQILFNPARDAKPQPCIHRETLHHSPTRLVRGLRAPPFCL